MLELRKRDMLKTNYLVISMFNFISIKFEFVQMTHKGCIARGWEAVDKHSAIIKNKWKQNNMQLYCITDKR